jgi:uncharacterized protein (DUF4415 family)
MSNDDRNVDMQDEYDFSQAQQGPAIPPKPGKTRITIRVDTDLLDWFRDQVDRQGGGNYQTMINEALRTYVSQHLEGGQLEKYRERMLRWYAEQLARAPGASPGSETRAECARADFLAAHGLASPVVFPGPWVPYEKEALRELVREVVREELERTQEAGHHRQPR